jgi:homocysteine S-methyltransferase
LLARQSVAILDGGLATELEAHGHDLSGALWSARLLRDDPAAIAAVHASYLAAGADIITTATYQASLPGWIQQGCSTQQARALLTSAVRLAREVVYQTAHPSRPALVAASLGPYGATLADGSEYRGGYGRDATWLVDWHRERFELLSTSGADLLALETIPDLEEIEALCRLLEESSGPVAWLSFSCRDGSHLADGTPLIAAAERAAAVERIVAVGVNCVPPQHVATQLEHCERGAGKPLIAYPNSGETWSSPERRWRNPPETGDFPTLAARWLELGASVIGGCCRVGPRTISALRSALLADG